MRKDSTRQKEDTRTRHRVGNALYALVVVLLVACGIFVALRGTPPPITNGTPTVLAWEGQATNVPPPPASTQTRTRPLAWWTAGMTNTPPVR